MCTRVKLHFTSRKLTHHLGKLATNYVSKALKSDLRFSFLPECGIEKGPGAQPCPLSPFPGKGLLSCTESQTLLRRRLSPGGDGGLLAQGGTVAGGKETVNRRECRPECFKILPMTRGEKVALAPVQLAPGLRAMTESLGAARGAEGHRGKGCGGKEGY